MPAQVREWVILGRGRRRRRSARTLVVGHVASAERAVPTRDVTIGRAVLDLAKPTITRSVARSSALTASSPRQLLPRCDGRQLHAMKADMAKHDDDSDIEDEDTGEAAGVKPWDPSQIRVATKAYSLRQVVDEIGDAGIDLAPDFQRDYVWKDRQKTLLVESILLGIPLPAFYFNANADNTVQVVDGVQRLSTVRDFAGGSFRLTDDLEYLKDLEGKRYSQLEVSLRRRFNQTQIVAHVIEATSPPDVKYDIFRRINTGGSPLTPQEIRHCMARDRSRGFLHELASLEWFRKVTHLKSTRRMEDRELALRYVAFSRIYDDDRSMRAYEQFETLDRFLLKASGDLDSENAVSSDELRATRARFERAMKNALLVFEDHAFRKWTRGGGRRSPLNKALFESWAVVLSHYAEKKVERFAEQLRERARDAMTDNPRYMESITYGTGRSEQVRIRFRTARELVEEVAS